VRMGFARLPQGVTWAHIYGLSCLAGIGFTMSLFIGGLSFSDAEMMNQVRLGVLSGSIISAILGYVVLMATTSKPAVDATA
jgi:NhaA family Na+:H+ antiporter